MSFKSYNKLLDPDRSRSIGIIVPPSNPVVEYEIRQLLDNNVFLYINRLPVCDKPSLKERNQVYLKSYIKTIKGFGNLNLQVVLIACTGPQYGMGLDADIELCKMLSEKTGVRVITASLVIYEVLEKLGAKKLHLELPYPKWLIEESISYWEGANFSIVKAVSLLDKFKASHVYNLNSEQLTESIKSNDYKEGIILVSGTGMASLNTILEMKNITKPKILSSNLCLAIWLINNYDQIEGNDIYKYIMQ